MLLSSSDNILNTPVSFDMTKTSPERDFAEFLSKYSPPMVRLAKVLRTKMRATFPGAIELVYDNYNALVLGFSPTERPSEAVFSLAVMPRWVALCFLQGATLPDPGKVLEGSGNKARHIKITDATRFDDDDVQKLIKLAIQQAGRPMSDPAKQKLIIRSVSAKQRPRQSKKS
jgi:hypothetical protein